jgi:hypothetical protein
MIFSSELDGMAHIHCEWGLEKQRMHLAERLKDFNPNTIADDNLCLIEKKFTNYISIANQIGKCQLQKIVF